MFTLDGLEPVTVELIPAREGVDAVTATFNGQPSPLSLRAARRAVAAIQRDGLPDAIERAGDAFSREIVRHNLRAWSGIGDADGKPVEPTPDREVRDEDGNVIETVPGTISGFLAQTRLMEAVDREYVLPWSLRDAEKTDCRPRPLALRRGRCRRTILPPCLRSRPPRPVRGVPVRRARSADERRRRRLGTDLALRDATAVRSGASA